MILNRIIIGMCLLALSSLAKAQNEAFRIDLSSVNASTRLSYVDSKGAPREVRASHDLRISWGLECLEGESLYCFYPRVFNVHSEDDQANPFVRTVPRDSLPPSQVTWVGEMQSVVRGLESLSVKNRFGASFVCDRLPSEVKLIEVEVPVWKAKRTERVVVPITQERVWQTLPNGSRVMFIVKDDYGKHKRIAVYREHAFSVDHEVKPPPFLLVRFVEDGDSEGLRRAPSLSRGSLLPDNPADADTKRVVFIEQRFDPEYATPTSVELVVVHEYEQVDLKFRVEDLALGDAVPYDKVAP